MHFLNSATHVKLQNRLKYKLYQMKNNLFLWFIFINNNQQYENKES